VVAEKAISLLFVELIVGHSLAGVLCTVNVSGGYSSVHAGIVLG
jgi:hypothetical protein